MDNVDQNVSSSDGERILHVMGVVERSTPLSANEARKLPSLPQIPRQKLRKAPDLAQGKGIPILKYEIPEKFGLSKLMFKKMSEITLPLLQPKYLYLDTLWYALRFNPKIDPESRPSWSGYMSMVSSGHYQRKSMVHMLFIIDLDSNDMPCIY